MSFLAASFASSLLVSADKLAAFFWAALADVEPGVFVKAGVSTWLASLVFFLSKNCFFCHFLIIKDG
jgi:hypothetical protein